MASKLRPNPPPGAKTCYSDIKNYADLKATFGFDYHVDLKISTRQPSLSRGSLYCHLRSFAKERKQWDDTCAWYTSFFSKGSNPKVLPTTVRGPIVRILRRLHTAITWENDPERIFANGSGKLLV